MNEIPPRTDGFAQALKKETQVARIKKAALICVVVLGALLLTYCGERMLYQRPSRVYRQMTVSTVDGEVLVLVIDAAWQRRTNQFTQLIGAITIGEYVYTSHLVSSYPPPQGNRRELDAPDNRVINFTRPSTETEFLTGLTQLAFYNDAFEMLMVVSSAYDNRQFFGPASTAAEAREIKAALLSP